MGEGGGHCRGVKYMAPRSRGQTRVLFKGSIHAHSTAPFSRSNAASVHMAVDGRGTEGGAARCFASPLMPRTCYKMRQPAPTVVPRQGTRRHVSRLTSRQLFSHSTRMLCRRSIYPKYKR